MRKRRGVRGRDWRKRRVCERMWLEGGVRGREGVLEGGVRGREGV